MCAEDSFPICRIAETISFGGQRSIFRPSAFPFSLCLFLSNVAFEGSDGHGDATATAASVAVAGGKEIATVDLERKI